jgi:kynurenine 3-monooxygenase
VHSSSLRKKIEAKFSSLYPELWTPLYSLVTFSPGIPYAEALRMGDEQKKLMDQVMAMPDIERDWDRPAVMDRLFELVSGAGLVSVASSGLKP